MLSGRDAIRYLPEHKMNTRLKIECQTYSVIRHLDSIDEVPYNQKRI